MRRVTCLLALLGAVALLPACGDDGGGGGSSGSGGSSEAELDLEPASTADDGCTTEHPDRVAEPSDFHGFIVLCASADGTAMTLENLSEFVVLDARPAAGQTWYGNDVTPPPDPTFVQQLTVDAVPASCDAVSCTIPAGSTMLVEADGPVSAVLGVGSASATTLAVSTVVAQINARLGTPMQRLGDQAALCAREALDTAQGARNIQEHLRNVLETGGSCTPLARQIDEIEGGQRPAAVRSLAARARSLLGSSVNDFLVAGATIALR